MKNIDIKSVIIGVLLTTTVIFGMGASKADAGKWDDKQVWYVKRLGWDAPKGHATRLTNRLQPQGFEPFAATDKSIFFRKRIK